MNFIYKIIGTLAGSIVILSFLVWMGMGIYEITTVSQSIGGMEFLSTNEFSIPVGQIVSYMFLSTICFFLKKYKLGLMVSFAYVFNWGFLHASANFVDMMGKPTPGLIVYLCSGLTMAVLVVVGFFREE